MFLMAAGMSRWKITPWHMLGGAALYAGSAYGFYSYLAGHKLPTAQQAAPGSEAGPARGTFDAIAEKYDTAVGSEEWAMGTHHLRRWILNHACGDVLEISAGTGRNLVGGEHPLVQVASHREVMPHDS